MKGWKYALEIFSDSVLFAVGCLALILTLGGQSWHEPNHWILTFEIVLSAVIVCIGIERLIDDIRHRIKSWQYAFELLGDLLTITAGGKLLADFITFRIHPVQWEASVWMFVMIGLAIVVGMWRTFDDALK